MAAEADEVSKELAESNLKLAELASAPAKTATAKLEAPETTAAAFFTSLQQGLEATHGSEFASEELKAKAKMQLPIMAELLKSMHLLVAFNRDAAVEEERCRETAKALGVHAEGQAASSSTPLAAVAPPVATAPPTENQPALVFGPSDRTLSNRRSQPYGGRTLGELQAIARQINVKDSPKAVA